MKLTGPGGLLGYLTRRVLEAGLEGEMDGHVGYEEHAVEGRNGGNSRNGTRTKTVITDVGSVDIEVPRDRDGTFETVIVRRHQRRLGGVYDMVLSLSAKGLTTGEISAHLDEVYGTSISKDALSAITDRVLAEMAEWQSRPLDATTLTPTGRRSWQSDSDGRGRPGRPTGCTRSSPLLGLRIAPLSGHLDSGALRVAGAAQHLGERRH